MAQVDEKSKSGYGGAVIGLVIVTLIGMALFGDWFDAGQDMLAKTTMAQKHLSESINKYFMENGRLEVKTDYSVIVYISKSNYEHIPYPDRKIVLNEIGGVWCGDKNVYILHLPKVQLRDIKTGETLATYRCFGTYSIN